MSDGTSVELQLALEHWSQSIELSDAEAVSFVRELVTQVARLHATGRWHGAIRTDTLQIDLHASTVSLPEPEWPVIISDNTETWPPELRSAVGIELTGVITSDTTRLRSTGIKASVDRVDVYQLGVLLIRLITGGTVNDWIFKSAASGKATKAVRRLIDQALGYSQANRIDNIAAFCEELSSSLLATVEKPDSPSPNLNNAAASATPTGADTTFAWSSESQSTTDAERPPFAKLGHYEVVSRIGHGGMGDVYKGYERALDRAVAIKVLPPDFSRQDDFVRRFYAEAAAAAKLRHPNSIEVYYVGEDAGHHFFVMQYVDGESLAELIDRKGKLDVDEVLNYAEQALAGLAAAHEQGLVHRDIKPGNILLHTPQDRVLLADFGLAKSMWGSSSMTATGVVMGTVDYISPEQARGHAVDARSDLYSIGVVIYELLSGQLPFKADSPTAMIFQHVYEPPAPLHEVAPHVPLALVAVVARLMAKSPELRYQSSEEVQADLRAVRLGESLPSRADSVPLDEYFRPPKKYAHATAEGNATGVIAAPEFQDQEGLPSEFDQPTEQTRWQRLQMRLRDAFYAQAPDFLKQLQNTQQQMDGAVFEYGRRRDRLDELIREAEDVLTELETQRQGWLKAGQQAQQAAENQVDTVARQAKEDDARKCLVLANELGDQITAQKEQLDAMLLALRKVATTHECIQHQRDLLNARFNAAQAQFRLAGGRIAKRRWARGLQISRVLAWTLITSIPWQTFALAALLLGIIFLAGEMAVSMLAMSDVKLPSWLTPTESTTSSIPTSAPRPEPKPVIVDATPAIPLRQLLGHGKAVRAISFLPDGRLSSVSDDRSLRIWNVDSGSSIQGTHKLTNGASALAVSPDGQLLASGSLSVGNGENTIQLWDATSGRLIDVMPGQTESIRSVAFSPDGTLLASAHAVTKPHWRIWKVADRQELQTVSSLSQPMIASFGVTGHVLALTGTLGAIKRWDSDTAAWLSDWQTGRKSNITSVSFTRNGVLLAAAHADGSVSVVDTKSGKIVRTATKLPERATSVKFHPAGQLLAISGQNSVAIYDIEQEAVRKVLQHPRVCCMAYSADGRLLVTGSEANGNLLVWDAAPGPIVIEDAKAHHLKGMAVSNIATVRDGLLITDKNTAIELRSTNFEETRRTSAPDNGRILAVSVDGQLAASVDEKDETVSIWETSSGRIRHARALLGPKSQGRFQTLCVFRPDNSGAVVVQPTRHHVWNFADTDVPRVERDHRFSALSATVSPDCRLLATGSYSSSERMGDLRTWDVRTGVHHKRFVGHEHYVWSVAFSPDGRKLLSGGRAAMHLWDVETGAELHRFGVERSMVEGVAFSPSGEYVAAADSKIRIWNTSTGEEAIVLNTRMRMQTVLFSADGRFVATESHLWPLRSRPSLAEPQRQILSVLVQ